MTDTPENRQYVACKFRVGDTKTFTYHSDGESFADGDVVRVPARNGGWTKVYVAAVGVPKPTDFDTKPIIGRHVEVEPTPLETAAATKAKHCKAAGVYNIVNGICTTCEKPEADCPCLPF